MGSYCRFEPIESKENEGEKLIKIQNQRREKVIE
jgi:hypothetical protein